MGENAVRATPRTAVAKNSSKTPAKGLVDAVAEYVEYLATPLRLRDWSITVDGSSFSPGAYADMTSYPDQKRATLRIGAQFAQLPQEEQTQTLVHEMLHCHLFAVHHAFDRVVETAYGSGKAATLANHLADASIESTTDALADVLAPFVDPFVMPKLPRKSASRATTKK